MFVFKDIETKVLNLVKDHPHIVCLTHDWILKCAEQKRLIPYELHTPSEVLEIKQQQQQRQKKDIEEKEEFEKLEKIRFRFN
eukprot:Awhi_evm1s11420